MAASTKSLLGLAAIVAVTWLASQWWGEYRRAGIGADVASLARPGDLQMVSSTTCPICTTARTWFKAHEVKFDECYIERDAACAARFESARAPGTPVIFVRGVPQVGFSPERLRDSLSLR